jgi:hypothetical protein
VHSLTKDYGHLKIPVAYALMYNNASMCTSSNANKISRLIKATIQVCRPLVCFSNRDHWSKQSLYHLPKNV